MRGVVAIAAAAALCSAASLAAAGCGLGAGPSVGDVQLTVTHGYGADPVLSRDVSGVRSSDTVMRVLDRSAPITTRYGGDFVQSIDGTEAGRKDGRNLDWFFYVNGIESPVGAADRPLHGGERVWWDYRDWTDAISVPAVVGSYPAPFAPLDGEPPVRVAVECRGGGSACATVRDAVSAAGADLAPAGAGVAVRVLVGPWARVRGDTAAAEIEKGPQFSGVFAEFGRRAAGFALSGLSAGGGPRRFFGPDSGLVAATRHNQETPVWLVTGARSPGVEAAAGLLDEADLRDHYAVAVDGDTETPLPLP